MSKPLINQAIGLFALLCAAAVFWRPPVYAGFLARALRGPTARLSARSGDALLHLLIAGLGLHARAAVVSARGRWPQVDHYRGHALRPLARTERRSARACSTTAFGLFDATRERGMGHPAG